MSEIGQLPSIVTAIGALGTASFGLVDASKVVRSEERRVGKECVP